VSAHRHAGNRLAALADGRLPEPERTQVLDHLRRCATCRSDYDAQLAMKGLLRTLGEPGPPSDLQARLAGLAATGAPRAQGLPGLPGLSGADRPPGQRGSRRPLAGRRERRATARAIGRRPSATVRAGRAGAGIVSVAVLAIAGAYALGGAPEGVAVSPPIDRFAREHAAVSGGLPLTEPVLWQLPASAPSDGQGASPVRLPILGSAGERAAPAAFGATRGTP
jgi:anti-sigma factor RsiW